MVDEKHFVLSPRAVVRDDRGRCLMIRRSASSTHQAGKWELPGGKMDSGEDFETALLHEVREETGLKISLDCVVGAAQWEHPEFHVAYIILEAHVTGGEMRTSGEHQEVAWVEPPEILSMDVCEQFLPFLETYYGSEEEEAYAARRWQIGRTRAQAHGGGHAEDGRPHPRLSG